MQENHVLGANCLPLGGATFEDGVEVQWDKASVEDVIKVACGRLEFLQNTNLKNDNNRLALLQLKGALSLLEGGNGNVNQS